MDISINAVRHENVTVTISNEELVKSLKKLLYTSECHFIKNTPGTSMESNQLSLFLSQGSFSDVEIRELTVFENEYFNACLTIENYLKHHVKP